MKTKASIERRFWSKVQRCSHPGDCTTCCWLWTAGTVRRGYGCLRVEGRTRLAHKLAYELTMGPLLPLPGLHICHRCDNPACVNPAHLWIGTPGDNMADRQSKKRGVRGENHGRARLNACQVQEIRAASACGMRQCDLAKVFNVSHTTIRRIVQGERWGHIPGIPMCTQG